MTTKLTWRTDTPPHNTQAIIIVKGLTEPNFITIAEFDEENQAWFEVGGLNLHLGGYEIMLWTDLKQLNKLLKE